MPEAAVSQEYNWMARTYDQVWRRYLAQTLSFLKTWASLPASAVVLDVASGTGVFEQLVLAEHPRQHMVACDLSPTMLQVAKHKLAAVPTVTFATADVTALPFANAQFDAVVCASALHYFAEPRRALAEMRRVANRGGSIFILDWCRDYATMDVLDTVLRRVDPAHHRCYTLAELHDLLLRSGLTVEAAQRFRAGAFWGLMVATAK